MIERLRPEYNFRKKTNHSNWLGEFPSCYEKLAKNYWVQYKDEPEFLIKNLNRFCREKKLNEASVNKVINGEYSHTANWKIRREEDKEFKFKPRQTQEWIVVSPDGVETKIRNLRQFCLGHSLEKSHMLDVANGKSSHHRQWKCRRAGEKEQPYTRKLGKTYKITYPDGRTEIVRSLKAFCDREGVGYAKMTQRGIDRSKGISCEKVVESVKEEVKI